MTDHDIIQWLAMLAPRNAQRATIVTSLLKHKAQDKMKSKNVRACRRAVELLTAGRVPESAGPKYIAVPKYPNRLTQ